MTFRLTRRRFLFLGVTAGVAAVLGGVAVWPDPAALEDDPASYRVLAAHDRAILAALAPAMLAGAWPTTPEAATTETQALLLRSRAPDPYQRTGARTFLHPSVLCTALMPEPVDAYAGRSSRFTP